MLGGGTHLTSPVLNEVTLSECGPDSILLAFSAEVSTGWQFA